MTASTALSARPPSLARWATYLAGRRPWPRVAWAFGFGLLSVLAMPPANAVPVLLVAVPCLLWLLDGAGTGRAAFAATWAFAFGQLVAGLYWIAFALTVDLAAYWWLIPVAVAGLPAALALIYGLAGWLAWRLTTGGLGRALVFAALWALAEWLRGHILTGFPWNLAGAGWSGWPVLLQSMAWIGLYGLSALTILVAALPAALVRPAAEDGRDRRLAPALLAAGLAVFAALGAGGGVRLSGATEETVPDVVLRLVQPAFPQAVKNDPAERDRQLRTQLEMSLEPPAGPPPTHVIWAETAVPYLVEPGSELARALGRLAGPGGLMLTGAVRAEPGAGPGGESRYYNSVLAIAPDGQVLDRFDKAHLVPFGEYVPFRDVLPIEKITPGSVDFTAGPGPRTLELPGLPPVSPLICYEVIFPGEVVDRSGLRPGWLLNLTNDGWYGRTAGPHQHFEIARTRAVEEGLPLVRVAMSGISGVVDAWGREVARIGLGEAGVVDTPLPAAGPRTLYSRVGDAAFWVIVASALAAGLWLGRRAGPGRD